MRLRGVLWTLAMGTSYLCSTSYSDDFSHDFTFSPTATTSSEVGIWQQVLGIGRGIEDLNWIFPMKRGYSKGPSCQIFFCWGVVVVVNHVFT